MVKNPIDIGMRSRPDLEAREMALQIDRQRRPQSREAGLYFSVRSSGKCARCTRSAGKRPESGITSLSYSAISSVSQTCGALVQQARTQDRRRQQQDFGPLLRSSLRGDDLFEV